MAGNWFRKIPTKVVYHGNYERCAAVHGYADSMIEEMGRNLHKRKITQGWQQPITLESGQVIDMFVSFGLSVVNIYDGLPSQEALEENRKCPCCCNLTYGFIVKREESEDHPFYVYTVSVCNKEERYAALENIIGNDFTPWEEGQAVMLMPYNKFLFDCCNANFDTTGCRGEIDKVNETFSDSWRPTFRIVTLCPQLMRWYDDD